MLKLLPGLFENVSDHKFVHHGHTRHCMELVDSPVGSQSETRINFYRYLVKRFKYDKLI